ncbi:NUDIX hydrolase [Rhodopseudomonas sp. WA056]|uniref:NUDIX hydrolase n=1 Tax=Rhodopseudomonas sp. WA056 TaxID=2269367 RepID=UPI0013DFE67E|nr:NUDIX hydrolase [Rhodopseudomonas sp. WA056]NEW88898.1 NUDIX hydrolase [Rhodopseudomonas sp. WA056]
MVEVDFPTTRGDRLRTPVLAAGGIVLRRGNDPLFAVVRMRKRNDWVLPKGKLDHGETARQAAEREVLEETGHVVAVHEFIGTLVYDSGGRSKVVHFWRMEAEAEQTLPLMKDIRAVDWLGLDEAILRLSRSYEQAFLTQVGPLALEAAGLLPGAAPATPAAVPPPRCPTSPLPTEHEVVTDLAEAPSLAFEQPSDAIDPEPTPSMLQRLRRWLRGVSRL